MPPTALVEDFSVLCLLRRRVDSLLMAASLSQTPILAASSAVVRLPMCLIRQQELGPTRKNKVNCMLDAYVFDKSFKPWSLRLHSSSP